jgi:hypothetical protein
MAHRVPPMRKTPRTSDRSGLQAMNRTKASVAILAAICFASTVAILSDYVPYLFFMWAPGLTIASLVSRVPSGEAIYFFNVLSYVVLSLLLFRRRRIGDGILARIFRWMIVPTVFLGVVSCIPRFNSVLPRGMDRLSSDESGLRDGLTIGLESRQVKEILARYSVQASDRVATASETLDEGGSVSPGDHILYANKAMDAFRFPCRYDLKVTVVLGTDDKLKYRHVNRSALCL